MYIFGQAVEVGNSIGAVSFASIILFLVLYFLKPKPLRKVIPSLIFIENQKKRISLMSFFGRFVKDWLFIVQLFIFLMLCLSAAGLFTYLEMHAINKEVVFVIDASASSKVMENGRTRFDRAVELAKKETGYTNSIILVENSPVLVAQGTNMVNAQRLLGTLKPTDSTSNIWDAMILAGDTAKTSDAEIVVLSDFVDTNQKNPVLAKDLLMSKGFRVRLINLANSRNNLGIVSYTYNPDNTVTIDIKNYNPEDKVVRVGNSDVHVPAFSIQSAKVPVNEGENRITIDADDDFKTDNTLYFFLPKAKRSSILFITNKKNTYLQNAISSIDNVKIDIAEPPIVPKLDYDVIVFDRVNKGAVISGTMDDMRKSVSDGASIIIAAYEDLPSFSFGNLAPVNIESMIIGATPVVNTKQVPDFSDINFGQSSKFLKSEVNNNQTAVIAETIDGLPLVTLTKYGMGNILYYGILDDFNSFKYSTDYPIFWYLAIKKLTGVQPVSVYNLKIGDIVHSTEKISDPDNIKYDTSVSAEKTGFYTSGDNRFAVNLLNSRESQIFEDVSQQKDEYSDPGLQKKSTQKVPLSTALIGIAIILLMLDLYIIKRRGDL